MTPDTFARSPIYTLTRLWLVVVSSCTSAPATQAPHDAPPPVEARTTIGPNGGRVSVGDAWLIVPRGALSRDVELRIERSDEAPPAGYFSTAQVFRFLPESTRFDVPATVGFIERSNSVCAAIFWSREGAAGFERLAVTRAGYESTASVSHLGAGFPGIVEETPSADAGAPGDASLDVFDARDGAPAGEMCPRRSRHPAGARCLCDSDCPPVMLRDGAGYRSVAGVCLAGACTPALVDQSPCCEDAECEHGVCRRGRCARRCEGRAVGAYCSGQSGSNYYPARDPAQYCGADGFCAPYRFAGQSCSREMPCYPPLPAAAGVPGLGCIDGFCRSRDVVPGLPNARCETDGYCVSRHCVEGRCAACGVTGAACAAASDCCSNRCVGGRCGCMVTGHPSPDLGPCCWTAFERDSYRREVCIANPDRSTTVHVGCMGDFGCFDGLTCHAGECCAPLGGGGVFPCCYGTLVPYHACQCSLGAEVCDEDPDCCSGRCTSGRCACLSLDASCARNEECCSSTCESGRCACASASARCSANTDCCSGRCTAGRCDVGDLGTACRASAECSSQLCQSGRCACAADGALCTANAFCCSGSCADGACGCMATRGPCATDAQCCSGRCVSGACACGEPARPCASARDCCSGVCRMGACACVAPGGACADDAMCCAGRCVSGACTG